jgi:hypothetical protein
VGKKPTEQKQNNLDTSNKKGAEMIGSIMQGLEEAIVEVHRHEMKGDDDLRTPSLK